MSISIPRALAIGVALVVAPAAQADKSDWTKIEKEWGELYEQSLYRFREDNCGEILRLDWKYKWQAVEKTMMDKCEYQKVTEIIENNQKVLEIEYCKALWQQVRYYRAKYNMNEIDGDICVALFEPWPKGWEDVAKKGAKKVGKVAEIASVGIMFYDRAGEAETRDEAKGLWDRHRRTYSLHTDVMTSTKKYWEEVQRKLYPNCPPVTTTSSGRGKNKKQPDPPKDPVPPQDPVKTEASPPGGAKTAETTGAKADAKSETKISETGGGSLQSALPPDFLPPPDPKRGTNRLPPGATVNGFFDAYLDCGLDDTKSGLQSAACEAKVVKAATDAADLAGNWAIGRKPVGTGDAGRPADPVAFWGDSCHAMMELSNRFQPPAKRDLDLVIDHSRNRSREASGVARGLLVTARQLDSVATKESEAAQDSLEKAVKARKGSTAARELNAAASKHGETAATARTEALLHESLAWTLRDVAYLFEAHAARMNLLLSAKSLPTAAGPPINPDYCTQRINYFVAANRPVSGQPGSPGYQFGQTPGQYPAGTAGAQGGQPGSTQSTSATYATQGGVPGYVANPYGRTDPGVQGMGQPPGTFGAPVGGQRLGTGSPATGGFPTLGSQPTGRASGGSVLGTQPTGRSSSSPMGATQRKSSGEELLQQGGGTAPKR